MCLEDSLVLGPPPAPKGLPTFPFIDQGKDLGYTRERRKRRKRKTGEKKA
jgi:hypothetical protein